MPAGRPRKKVGTQLPTNPKGSYPLLSAPPPSPLPLPAAPFPATPHHTGSHPLPASAIPSDTTEWDPTMVDLSQMDPSYQPINPLSWGSSPLAPPPRPAPASFNSVLSTIAEGPALGVFPRPNLQITTLYPIPLNLSRPAGSRPPTPMAAANISSTETTQNANHFPLGTDIPPTRRATRSGTLMQTPVGAVGVAPRRSRSLVVEPKKPLSARKSAEPVMARRELLRRRSMGMQETLVGGEADGAVKLDPDELFRRLTQGSGVSVVVESPPRQHIHHSNGAKAGHSAQTPIGSSTSELGTGQPPAELRRHQGLIKLSERRAEKDQKRLAKNAFNRQKALQNRELKQAELMATVSPSSPASYTTAPNSPARTPRPRYLERIVQAPIVTVVGSSPTGRNADVAPSGGSAVLTPTPSPDRTFPPIDPTNPNSGTTRPGTETPESYDDPSWACSVMDIFPTPEQSVWLTPELESEPMNSPQSEDLSMEILSEGASGASSTSYSQRPRSPNSLINMYRVRADLTIKTPRGMSLYHTKKIYIGEKIYLDMDMPENGDGGVMEMDELDVLMGEMDDQKPGNEVKLDSVQKDLEIGGRSEKLLEYVRLS